VHRGSPPTGSLPTISALLLDSSEPGPLATRSEGSAGVEVGWENPPDGQ
jgi:hypothetical protein